MHRLPEKSVKRYVNWSTEQNDARELLKRRLWEATMPKLPDLSESAHPFILDADTSDEAIVGVLSQERSVGRITSYPALPID